MEEIMNITRLLISFVVVAVFIHFFDWFFHGMYLKGLYQQTMNLWRPESNMRSHMAWMIAGQVLIAFMFCFIFARTQMEKTLGEGLFFGVLIGLLFSGPHLIMHAVQPLPTILIFKWILGSIIEMAIAGALLGVIYKSKS